MMNWWDKNFASCELGDERLSNRGYSIGQKNKSRIRESVVRDI
ncbi:MULTISPECIES: IS4/Tn5 family transposase DNA-binding protein [Pseudanabaena]